MYKDRYNGTYRCRIRHETEIISTFWALRTAATTLLKRMSAFVRGRRFTLSLFPLSRLFITYIRKSGGGGDIIHVPTPLLSDCTAWSTTRDKQR